MGIELLIHSSFRYSSGNGTYKLFFYHCYICLLQHCNVQFKLIEFINFNLFDIVYEEKKNSSEGGTDRETKPFNSTTYRTKIREPGIPKRIPKIL